MKDFRFPPHEEESLEEAFRSMISAPLVSENKVIGILRMDSPVAATYTQDDLRLLDILSDLGALAIQNSYLYSRTQELAIKDSLTGLAVRRHFTGRLKEEMKRSKRPHLILFGTGWGLCEEVIDGADIVLSPICGETEYNHLSVRSAAAIVLDRLLGK